MKWIPFDSIASFAAFSTLALLSSPSAQAISVKADPLAAKGCIAKVSVNDAQAAMSRFNLHTMNARPAEVQTLGTSLVWIEKLNHGKPLDEAIVDTGYRYNFQNATRNSHQALGEIRVNRNGPKNYGENTAQLVHELGHLIGNNGGYEAYYDYVGRKFCKVSTYSITNHHEQFAEVFAAFVTRPELIKNNPSPVCQKAYKFFSTQLFDDAGPIAARCMVVQTNVLNRMNAKPGAPEVLPTIAAILPPTPKATALTPSKPTLHLNPTPQKVTPLITLPKPTNAPRSNAAPANAPLEHRVPAFS